MRLAHCARRRAHYSGLPISNLAYLCAQFQHLFSPAPPSSATRLRDFMDQADVIGLANFARLVFSLLTQNS
eukprot:117573-Pelagomonas_calceolata.AAC.1